MNLYMLIQHKIIKIVKFPMKYTFHAEWIVLSEKIIVKPNKLFIYAVSPFAIIFSTKTLPCDFLTKSSMQMA